MICKMDFDMGLGNFTFWPKLRILHGLYSLCMMPDFENGPISLLFSVFLRRFLHTLLAEPFLTVHMLCIEKRLCTNPVKFLLSMLSALLSNSFEPMPNRCSFLTVSFRRTFRRHFYLLPVSPKNWCSRLKNQFDESKPEWLAQELGLRRLQRMD